VKIVQRTWDELDMQAIAELTASAYRIEDRGDYTREQIERYLNSMNEKFPIEVSMLAMESGRLLGWLGLERKTENIGEIGRRQPYVGESSSRNKIAVQLIRATMKYAPAHGMKRLEIVFDEISSSTMKTYENRCSWFCSLGWNLVEDTYFMTTDSLKDTRDFAVPEGFQLKPLLEIDDNELYKCHYAAFTTSEAREFYDLTEEEKKQNFENLYDRAQEINSNASLVMMNGQIPVGIILVVSRVDEEHITVVAVHPDFRGKGLAKSLLNASIKELRKQGTHKISIGVDVVNTTAINLYHQYAFEVTSRFSSYAWKVKTR
jgi:ribosomal protein S18 acetylase RimI-like enzyme